jgi:hypothetical protein
VQSIGIPVYHFITGGAQVGKSGLLDPALVAWNNLTLADYNKRENMKFLKFMLQLILSV